MSDTVPTLGDVLRDPQKRQQLSDDILDHQRSRQPELPPTPVAPCMPLPPDLGEAIRKHREQE